MGRIAAPLFHGTKMTIDTTHSDALTADHFRAVGPGIYQAGRLELYDTEGFEARRDVEWLISGVLPSASLAVIYGRAGVMKTFLALDMALSVATGRDFVNMPTTRGRVVYFYLETPQTGKERVRAWRLDRGIGHVRDLFLVEQRPSIETRDDLSQLIEDLRQVRPSLVVFDTLSALVAGEADENQTADMQRLFGSFRQVRDALQAAILVIHHEGPSGLPRGSTVFVNDSDTVLRVQSKARTELAGQVYCRKQRGGAPEFKRLDFAGRLVPLGEDFEPWAGWTGTRAAPVLDYLNRIEPKLMPEDEDALDADQSAGLTARQQEALAAITKYPGCSAKELAEKIGKDKKTVRGLAGELEAVGLVRVETGSGQGGKRQVYFPAETGESAHSPLSVAAD